MEELFVEQFMDYILEQLQALLAIDSPSGFTAGAADYLLEEYRRLGFQPEKTKKGGNLFIIYRYRLIFDHFPPENRT